MKTLIITSLSSLFLLLPAKGGVVHEPVKSYSVKPKVQKTIKDTALQVVEPVVAVPVPEPAYVAPVAYRPPAGCVSGVVTGNFYEDYIIAHESGGSTCAVNASSGACNLFQELPCGKSGCSTSDVNCELAWGTGYANSRYGGWAGAYNFWVQNHWW